MKKSLLTIAAAATMIAPAIAMADATLYGNVHLSINDFDTADNIDMTSNTSAIGVKGSEDLGDGVKAIYKMEFGVDTADSGSITGRDQFVGLKGGMGTIKFGTMSSNYKQMGGKVDPLYRTRLEGRGFLGTQSSLNHGGRGITRGRSTNLVQYVSPKMSGIQLVANTTVSGADEETSGVGVRWSNKQILAFVDFIANDDADAVKVGGRYKTKAFSVGLQFEMLDDGAGGEVDHIFLSGSYNINKNNAIIVTAGQADFEAGGASADSTGIAVAYNHKLSKMTNVYIGYGDRSDDDGVVGGDEDVITAGIKKKF